MSESESWVSVSNGNLLPKKGDYFKNLQQSTILCKNMQGNCSLLKGKKAHQQLQPGYKGTRRRDASSSQQMTHRV